MSVGSKTHTVPKRRKNKGNRCVIESALLCSSCLSDHTIGTVAPHFTSWKCCHFSRCMYGANYSPWHKHISWPLVHSVIRWVYISEPLTLIRTHNLHSLIFVSDPQLDQSVSPWTADTNEPFLRILFNCLAGELQIFLKNTHIDLILICRNICISRGCDNRMCHCLKRSRQIQVMESLAVYQQGQTSAHLDIGDSTGVPVSVTLYSLVFDALLVLPDIPSSPCQFSIPHSSSSSSSSYSQSGARIRFRRLTLQNPGMGMLYTTMHL